MTTSPRSAVPVRFLFFAQVRLALDRSSADLDVPLDGGRDAVTVAGALRALTEAFPAVGPHLSSCRVAVGLEYARAEDEVPAGAELSLIPPVQGG